MTVARLGSHRHGTHEDAVERIRKRSRELRNEQVHVELQRTVMVSTLNMHRAAPPVRTRDEIEGQTPGPGRSRQKQRAGTVPAELYFAVAERNPRKLAQRLIFGEQRLHVDLNGVKIVGGKRGDEYAANLLVIASYSQFSGSAPNGQIVNHNLALIERALRNSPNLSELGIAEVLNAQPNTGPNHCQNQSQRASSRPQQKKAKQRK